MGGTPLPFFLISAKLMELSTRNLRHLSGHQFYTLCAIKNFVPTIGWPQMTSEWRHVLTLSIQNKGLQESLSWTQFLSCNQFYCMDWCRIDCPIRTTISDSQNFENKENVWQIFEKYILIYFFCRKNRNICYRIHQGEPVLKISTWFVKKMRLIRHFVLLYTGYEKCL